MSEQYYEDQEMIIDVQDEDVDVVDSNGEPTGSKNGLIGWAIGLGLTAVGVGVGIYKNRHKIKAKHEAKQTAKEIKKLEKKGYMVSKPIPIETVPDEVAVDEEQETDEE